MYISLNFLVHVVLIGLKNIETVTVSQNFACFHNLLQLFCFLVFQTNPAMKTAVKTVSVILYLMYGVGNLVKALMTNTLYFHCIIIIIMFSLISEGQGKL